MEMLFDMYLNGELAYELNSDELDVWYQFINHTLVKIVYKKANAKGMTVDFDLFWDDVFISLSSKDGSELPFDEQFDDRLQDMVDLAWNEVRTYEYFEKIINN